MTEKIAIYGGTFDPFHMGHIYCIQNILERGKIQKISVVPAYQNPLKEFSDGPTPEERLDMAQLSVLDYDNVSVDDQEILRGGKSYSYLTVDNYLEKYSSEQLHLVIGLDEFYQLDKWTEFESLLEKTNFIVISRPGNLVPYSKDDLPEKMRSYVSAIDPRMIILNTGRFIEFMNVPGLDISATEIRKALKTSKNVNKYLDLKVQNYIKDRSLYPLIGPKIGDYLDFTKYCADRLFYRKAFNLKAFELKSNEAPCNQAIVCSGTSKRHCQSMASTLVRDIREEYGIRPLSVEGSEEGRWVLIDYGDLIIHIFYDYIRTEYNIESLWKEKIDMDLKDPYTDQNED